jgi:site-specific DNA recombinase
VGSFAALGARERRGERYVARLAALAFVSPPVLTAIIEGTAPPHLTVTALAGTLPVSWTRQQRAMGIIQ